MSKKFSKSTKKFVLVAEDDVFYSESICRRLQDRGVSTIQAKNEKEALKILESHAADISVALLDIRMPTTKRARNSESIQGKESGLRLARVIRAKYPNIR